MKDLFTWRRKGSNVTKKSTTATNISHRPKCVHISLLFFGFCGTILAVLISTECDMMLVGRVLEPYWTMTLRRRSTLPSSDGLFPPIRQTLWINEVTNTMEQLKEATAKAPCYVSPTQHAYVFGLPSPINKRPVQLTAGPTHKLTILSYDIDGKSRCAGGDYFEADLSSNLWKSRPPIFDHANGSYNLFLQVDPGFTGLFLLQLHLAFTNFEGFVWSPSFSKLPTWRGDEVLKIEIEFILEKSEGLLARFSAGHSQAILPKCNATAGHFSFQRWTGRWTRQEARDECPVDANGRYRCLDLDTECQSPWCQGPIGRLESNGWAYSAHCSFKIFTEEEAWTCLDGKWLFFWGDSNHQDSIRNLLSFVLGFSMFDAYIDRRFDKTFNRSTNPQQSLRITNVFNGHQLETDDGQGLWALSDSTFRSLTERYFKIQDLQTPDVVILNSGLHDAIYWKTAIDYVNIGVELAIKLWQNIFEKLVVTRQPLVIYRHTVVTAGLQRMAKFNPEKLEWFTRVLGERLAKLKIKKFMIVDEFDMTFPWHYDLRCSDGMHYGRPPSNATWKDGIAGHHYFVDLMLVHIHLNSICPS